MGTQGPPRAVALVINDEKKSLEVRNHIGSLLRSIDFARLGVLEVVLVSDGKHLIMKNSSEYDCVLIFESTFLRESFYNTIKQRYNF